MSIDAMKLALEALEFYYDQHGEESDAKAITALRAAIEQAQEPVAWQEIETAPKTGKKVILFYLNRNNLPRRVMARWLTDEQANEIDTDWVSVCAECGTWRSKVLESRKDTRFGWRWRMRECLDCEHRWATYEVDAETMTIEGHGDPNGRLER